MTSSLTNDTVTVTGLWSCVQSFKLYSGFSSGSRLTIPYFLISLLLNILLTLMIIVRLALHHRQIQNAMGTRASGRLYTTIITILVESCALYAFTFLLLIVMWFPTWGSRTFWSIVNETQVRAVLLSPMHAKGRLS